MRFRLFAFTAAATLAACGGGTPKPAGLAYGLPAVTDVTYTTGDTATIDIDAGGQSFQIDRWVSATLGTTFTRAPGGLQVSVDVQALSGRQSNPMGAPATADGSGISGPLVFSLDRRGVVTVVSRPEVTGETRAFFEPLSLAHGFFPRLPGTAARVGDTWTDTIQFEGPQGDGTIKSTSVMTNTVVGDTVVGNRSVIKIAVEGTVESSATGAISGMDYSQKISGNVKGWVLWDLQRALMTETYSDVDATGTMDVAAAPYPLSMRLRSQSRTMLTGEM